MNRYKTVALGATFDFLHLGHREFLNYAFSISDRVLIGLTSDNYVSKFKYKQNVESFLKRKDVLIKYLKKQNLYKRSSVLPIDENTIPKKWLDTQIDALVLTEDTISGGHKLNNFLKLANKKQLRFEVFPMVIGEGDVRINSTSIRNGIIDSDGKLLYKTEWRGSDFILPEELRNSLQKPIGKIIDLKKIDLKRIKPENTISVGDVTTSLFINSDIIPKISVIDLLINRKKVYSNYDQHGFPKKIKVIKIKNPPGIITKKLFNKIQEVSSNLNKENVLLLIDGEEDLVVLPLIICLPLGYRIYYGQPGIGNVEVLVNLENKVKMRQILSKFTISQLTSK